jgi:hypothetical protein
VDPSSESINPLEMVANITDVMLVFAVAVMVALVANWKLDLSSGSATQIDESNLLGSDVTSTDIVESVSGRQYEEAGTVYRDVTTGEMYYLPDEDKAEEE